MDLSSLSELELMLRLSLIEGWIQAWEEIRDVPRGGCSLANSMLGGSWHKVESELTFVNLQQPRSMEQQLHLFALGVASLQMFVGANWTGMDFGQESEEKREEAEGRLRVDGEGVVQVAKRLDLLARARELLCEDENNVYRSNWVGTGKRLHFCSPYQ